MVFCSSVRQVDRFPFTFFVHMNFRFTKLNAILITEAKVGTFDLVFENNHHRFLAMLKELRDYFTYPNLMIFPSSLSLSRI